MFGEPAVQVGETVVAVQRSAALNCAAARPLEEHDQMSRDVERDRASEISSTSASDRSMPAVTPAEVHTGPSCTKIGSGSTVTAGGAGAAHRNIPSALRRGGDRAGRLRLAGKRRCRPRPFASGAGAPLSQSSRLASFAARITPLACNDQRVERLGRIRQRLGRKRQSRVARICAPSGAITRVS